MPAARLSRRRRSSHGLGLFTPAKPGTYTIPQRPVTFAPNVTPITYTAPDPDDDDIFLALSSNPSHPSYDPALDPSHPSYDPTSTNSSNHPSLPTATLFPPSLTPAPPPTRKRCPPGKRRSQGYIPRPPNAFMLFRADFVRQKHVPGTIETNHGSLSKIIGTCWRQLPLDEKRVWEIKAKHEKAAHKLMFPDYRFRPVHNKNKNVSSSHSSSTTKTTSSTGTPSSNSSNAHANGGNQRSTRSAPEAPNPDDERRCEEVAALLLEGKKGEELSEAVKRLDERREREREQEMMMRSYEAQQGQYDPSYDGHEGGYAGTPYDDGVGYGAQPYDVPPPAYAAYPASASSSALSLPPSSRASPASASAAGPVLHMPLPTMAGTMHPQFAATHNQVHAHMSMAASANLYAPYFGGNHHQHLGFGANQHQHLTALPQSLGAYHRRSSSVPLPSNEHDFFFSATQPQPFNPAQGAGQQPQGIALPEVPFMGAFPGRSSFSFGGRNSFGFASSQHAQQQQGQGQGQGQQQQQEYPPSSFAHQGQFTNPFSSSSPSHDTNTYLFSSIHPSPPQRNSLGLAQRRASSAQALLQSWTYDASFASAYYDGTQGQGMMERDHSPLPDVPAELFTDFSFSSSTSTSNTPSRPTAPSSQLSTSSASSQPASDALVDPISGSPRAPLSSISVASSAASSGGSTTAGSAYDGSPLPGMPAALGPTELPLGLGLGVDLSYMNLGMGMEGMYGAPDGVGLHDAGMYAHAQGPMDMDMDMALHVHAPKPQPAQAQAQHQAMWGAQEGGAEAGVFFEGGVFDV